MEVNQTAWGEDRGKVGMKADLQSGDRKIIRKAAKRGGQRTQMGLQPMKMEESGVSAKGPSG